MADQSYLNWPFLEDHHRQLAGALDQWCRDNLSSVIDHHQLDQTCRNIVAALGQAGWLKYSVPKAYGGHFDPLDVRSLSLIRQTLGYHDGLADFAFAMQGLGSHSISAFGSEELKQAYLPSVCSGERIAAFALSEPDAGSDVAAMSCSARADGPDHVVINGEKTWISNGGIAHHYVTFVREGDQPGAKGLAAYVIDAESEGLEIAERIDVIAPHPLARLRFNECRVPITHRLGEVGQGFKIAMTTLDVFRTTVGAAALGFARRALDEALHRATTRKMFGAAMSELPLTQATLGEMATDIDAAALLIFRAAWTKDMGAPRVTREAAMAKMHATEIAQSVIDKAVQIFGGLGVRSGQKVEELYREIRALRIYEGASEVQKLIIAQQTLGHYQAALASKNEK